METLLSVCIGIGLSAACGFRVFVPPLIASIAAHTGQIEFSLDWEWIGTTPVMVALAIATLIEIAAYYIPWVDNLLDSMTTPVAIIAGTLLTASFASEMSPQFQWSVAMIAGGGAAGTIQALTGVTRLASSITTGGFANPVVSTGETISSTVMSVLAIAVPILAMILLVWLLWLVFSKLKKRLRHRRN